MPVVGPRFPHVRLNPPLVVFGPAAATPQQQTINVTLAVKARRLTDRRRFPPQESKTFASRFSAGTSMIVLPARMLGPQPPAVVALIPTQQQQTVTVKSATDYRRRTNVRRFPLQGWTGRAIFSTGATTEFGIGPRGALNRLLGPKPPVVIAGLPTAGQQTIRMAVAVAARERRERGKRFPLQGWTGASVYEEGGSRGALYSGSQLTSTFFGQTSGSQERIAESIVSSVPVTINSIRIGLQLGATAPTDSAVVTLQTSSGGVPSGVILRTATIPSASLSSTTALYFDLPFSFALDAGVTYWIVFSRTVPDATSFYTVPTAASTPAFVVAIFNGTSWTSLPNSIDIAFLALTGGRIGGAFSRNLGPRPPMIVLPVLNQKPIFGPYIAPFQRVTPRRAPKSFLGQPQVLARPPPTSPIQVNTASGLLTNQRRVQQRAARQIASQRVAFRMWLEGTDGAGGGSAQFVLSNQWLAQSFVAPYANLRHVIARIERNGSPVATVTWEIQTDSGNKPSGVAVAGPVTIDESKLLTSGPSATVIPLTATLTPGVRYWLVAKSSNVDVSNSVAWADTTGIAKYAGGTSASSDTSGVTWAAGTEDLAAQLALAVETLTFASPMIGVQPPVTLTTSFLAAPIMALLANGLTNQRRLQQRRPMSVLRPPTVVGAAAVVPPVAVYPATGLYTNQRRAPQRRTTHTLGPLIFYPQTGVVAVTPASGLLTNQRRVQMRAPFSRLALPAALQTFSGPQVNLLPPDRFNRKHRRAVNSVLPLVIVPASTFVAPPLAVYCLQPDRLARRHRRQVPTTALGAPTVLSVFTGPTVTLTHTRPRRTARRLTTGLIFYPQTGVISVVPASGLLTNQRRSVMRRPFSRLAPPTVLQTFAGPSTPRVRVRPRPTTKVLRPPATLQPYSVTLAEDTIRATLTHTRPRPTRRFLNPPTVTRVPSVEQRQQTVSVSLVRIRPRAQAAHLFPPTVLQTFATAQPTLARTRPRRVVSVLPLVVVTTAAPVKTVIAVTLVRTRPRRTFAHLTPPTVLQVFGGVKVTLVRTRTPSTRRYLAAPTVVRVPAVEQRQQTISVALVRTRPRHVVTALPLVITATASPVETVIAVSLVRTRPRRTTGRLAPPTVLQVFSGAAVTITRIRPRPTRRYLTAPTVVRVPAVEQREQTISVTVVRARPRPTTRRLSAPTVLRTFPAAIPTLARIRPRRTGWLLRPPTVVRVPSVEQQEDTIRVSLVRIRPRPTRKRLAAPAALQIFTGPSTHLVRTRPRPTVHTLGEPTVLQTFSGPAVSITRIRPRPTAALLSAPAALQVFSGPLVAVTRIRPRPTSHFFTEAFVVTVPAVEQQEETVKVTVVRTRPRPTTKFLSPPTVLQTFEAGTPTLARIRPRPTDKVLGPPTVVRVPAVEQREQTITVVLVRSRPRPTRRFLNPPTVIRVPSVEQRQQTVRVTLVRTRPRPTTKTLFPPTVLSRPPVRPLAVSYLGPNQRRDWNRRFPNQGQRQRLVRETGTTVTCQQRDPFIGPRPPQIIDPLPGQRAQTVTVTLVAVRTRRELPRHVVKYALRPPTRVNPLPTQGQQTIEEVYLQAIRRRTTDVRRLPHSVLGEGVVARPPVETEIRVLSQALHASLDRIPRRIRSVTVEPVSYPQTSTITVALVRTRPRPTISRLTAVSYPQTGEIQVTTVRARPRPKRALLKPPTVVRVPSVEQQEDTIRVSLVRIRPRPKQAALRRPDALSVFSGPQTHLARIRPRPTHPVLRAPAAVLIPAVEQRLHTITVSLVRIRPPQTHARLTPPTALRTFAGPVEAEVSVSLVSGRPRRIPHSRLAAPTVVAAFIYPPLIQRLTPGRRPTVYARLSPPTILRTEPPVDVRPTVALVGAKTRQRFRVGRWTLPKILPPYPSVLIPETTGAAVPTAYSDGHSVPAGDTDGAARASTATEGRTVPVAESDGKAVPDATTDGGVLT